MKVKLCWPWRGVNVIFWFASSLLKVDGKPQVAGPLPDLDCVARVRKSIEAKDLDTRHLITIGGWNGPHPDTSFTGEEWFHAWHTWNQGLALPFDGFDWDLEGNDWTQSRYNVFSSACMQLVVDMSSFAKKTGYLVTMAPAQTYFDVTTSKFNRFLNNSNEDYHPDFFYRGRNCYAYWWAAAPEGTFDLVTIQLYESYAPAMQALHSGISEEEYLQSYAAQFLNGWTIHFDDPSLPLQGDVKIQVPHSKLLLGVSWGSPPKWAFFWPEQLAAAYQAAKEVERPRGYSFWMIGLEDTFGNHSNRTLSFAHGLNQFLHVRGGRRMQSIPAAVNAGEETFKSIHV